MNSQVALECYLHVCCVLQLLYQLHRGVQVRPDGVHGAFLLSSDLLHLSTQSSVTSLNSRQTLQQLNGVPLKHTRKCKIRPVAYRSPERP